MVKPITIICCVCMLMGCSAVHKSFIDDGVKDMRFNMGAKTAVDFAESDRYCKKSAEETTTHSLLTGALLYVHQAQKSYQRCMEEHGFKCIEQCKDL